MPDGLSTLGLTDPLVASVRERVSGLADGNPLPASGFSFEGSRVDRAVRLTLRVDIDRADTVKTLKGQVGPEGSTRCGDPKAAADFPTSAFRRAAVAPATLEKVATTLGASPEQVFTTLKDPFEIGVTVGSCHVHLPCGTCGQTGLVDCGRCRGNGVLSCPSCNDGQRACTSCSGGQVQTSERVWNSASQCYVAETRYQRCSSCSGSGRTGTCYTCHGRRRVTCQACGGDGRQECDDCGRTGWLTRSVVARLVGKPVRALSFEDGAPLAFRVAVEALATKDIPVLHGKVKRSLVETAEGTVGMGLECTMPHVALDAEFEPGIVRRFDAVGLRGEIPSMPAFLDPMLASLSNDIDIAAHEKRHADVLRLAKDSRVTCSVLVAVSGREGHGVEALRTAWQGAASDPLLGELLDHVRKAYDGIGASVVRKPWKLLALPVVAFAAAAYPLKAGHLFLPASTPRDAPSALLATGACGLLPLAIVFLLARRRARRAVRALVGSDAVRTPRQGAWAKGTTMLAVIAVAVGAFASGAVSMASLENAAAVALAPTPVVPEAFVEDVPAGQLSRSSLPPLLPSFHVTRTIGSPPVYWLQYLLGQLGFLHAEPDGVLHPATTEALRRFNMTLPSYRKAALSGWDATKNVALALRDQFPLQSLPADRFPVPLLSNLARANLTAADILAMRRAAEQALASPGRVAVWRSADGARGGRLVAIGSRPCPSLQVEVEVRGAVETKGPFANCDWLRTPL